MNVLLMGGSGIISSEICSLAIQKGYSVTILNRGNRKDKINPKALSISCDLKQDNVDDIISKLDPQGYDVIVDFVTYDRLQLKRSLNIAEGRCKQFIFISSSTAYLPKKNGKPYIECDPVGDTGWQYAFEKAMCEQYIENHIAEYSFQFTIIRPYITYGETRIPYQVAPIKYFTLVNRLLNNKPIPIFGRDIQCTLTWSADFAVGAVGLFMNPSSYGEAFHITSDEVITWYEIIQIIANKLEIEARIIDVDTKVLLQGRRKLGFDIDEILYDKSRCMLFDNSKIHKAVPAFCCKTSIRKGIESSIEYFMKNPEKQFIDYEWDARIDRMIEKAGLWKDKVSILEEGYAMKRSYKEKWIYRMNRWDLLYYVYIVYRKLIR